MERKIMLVIVYVFWAIGTALLLWVLHSTRNPWDALEAFAGICMGCAAIQIASRVPWSEPRR